MGLPQNIQEIVNEVIELLDPHQNLQEMIEIKNEKLIVNDQEFNIENKKIHIFATGKAASFEARALKQILSDSDFSSQIQQCVSYTKMGHTVGDSSIFEIQGNHPVISAKNLEHTQVFLSKLKTIEPEDYLLFLLSGGASALLEKPIEGISFIELKKKHEELLVSGKSINEMNRIRKSLSQVKDGGLLKFISTKNIIQFITCDIPNENLADVSSGPLLGSKTPEILKNTFKIQSASKLLQQFCSLDPKRKMGKVFDCLLETMIDELKLSLPEKDEVLVSGGEATIQVPALSGKGGRNTHFVLAFAKEIYSDVGNRDIHIISLGTDGGDGPTDAAGAYINYQIYCQLEADSYLSNFNSYEYFEKVNSLLITGPTKTNVMDLRILWRE
jgi:glycerate-2-kinase